MKKLREDWWLPFVVITLITIIVFWTAITMLFFGDSGDSYDESCGYNNNVAVVKIRGEILAYPYNSSENTVTIAEDLIYKINELKNDSTIEAVILDIDSPGGDVAASELIMQAVKDLHKRTAAVVLSRADSGAYLIASAADKIYAAELSEVGSIGVTLSYLDRSEKNKKEGISYKEISSGKYKDIGVADRPLSIQEQNLLLEQVKKGADIFISHVAHNRLLEKEAVIKLADGSVFWGNEAHEKGLIDEIGNMQDALDWISDDLKIKPEVCMVSTLSK